MIAKSATRKSPRPKSHGHKIAKKTKPKTLAQVNRWMEAHPEMTMQAARRNTLRLTGEEVL